MKDCHSGEVFVIFATIFTASLHRGQIPLYDVGLREFDFLARRGQQKA
jgi:hypothetical protein